jgi:UDP-glucuronate decarboxylase
MACPASPEKYQYDPVQTVKTSVHGSINMLGLAKRVGARILQASTSEIYGDPEQHPQTEEYWGKVNPLGIRACYDEGKRCAETLFFSYKRQHGVSICVARIFNTFGPRMHVSDGRVVSNFAKQAILNEDITIYGDGSQTRSFCYVSDLIDGLIALMNHPEGFAGPVNLGTNYEITVSELASKIIELTGSTSKLGYQPMPEDDPRQRQPDISLAYKELNWSPKIKLEDGLRKTVDHFRSVLEACLPPTPT